MYDFETTQIWGGIASFLIDRGIRLIWLGWLACCAQPWLGLAWACLACLALAWSSNNNRPPSAAGGGGGGGRGGVGGWVGLGGGGGGKKTPTRPPTS